MPRASVQFNETLAAAVTAAIDAGKTRFTDIHNAVGGSHNYHHRDVDRALQQLRRTGILQYGADGWSRKMAAE